MTGLLRYQRFVGIGISFVSIWYAILSQQPDVNIVVRFAPIWACIGLALYAIASIGYGVIICKDVPEAAKEIERQVKEAKIEMKKRAVIQGN